MAMLQGGMMPGLAQGPQPQRGYPSMDAPQMPAPGGPPQHQMVQPGPQQAMGAADMHQIANQLYIMQNQIAMLMEAVQMLQQRPMTVNMQVRRSDDGRITGATFVESRG